MYLDFQFCVTVFRIAVLSQPRFYNGKKHWPKKEKNCISAHTYTHTHTPRYARTCGRIQLWLCLWPHYVQMQGLDPVMSIDNRRGDTADGQHIHPNVRQSHH